MGRTVGIAATAATAAIATTLMAPQAEAQSDDDSPMASVLAVEIATLREQYEERIKALEEQIRVLQSRAGIEVDTHDGHDHGMAAPHRDGGMLDPQIFAVLRGSVTSYSAEHSDIAGFQLGHESERAPEGISLGHSELGFASDVGDALHAGLVLGIGVHPGEPVELELEEAYFQTLPGLGLPEELTVAAGRKLWSFGYLNELHAHEGDFADRPLPYRAFLDGAFNDDGLQLSLALPGDVRTEIGGGLFRGDDRPFGGSDNGRRAYSAYARIGGDMGRDSSWGIGLSLLSGEVGGSAGGHAHDHGDEGMDDHAEDDHDEDDHDDENGHDDMDDHDGDDMDDHDGDDHDDMDDHDGDDMDDHDGDDHDDMDDHDEDDHDDMDDHEDEHDDDHADEAFAPASFFSDGMFSGDRDLLGADIRFAWAPTGDARQSELILQGEYLWQLDDGLYRLDDDEMEVDGSSAGWYAQAVYKLAPEWRIGARYARLSPPGAAEIDHDPSAVALMGDWTSDRFGQLRLQYNRESLADGQDDDQVILQYTVSLGGHGGHAGHDH
ncbi:MAG: hypothetical protein OXI57_11605 [Rhodospirillales bacterium]|nr:hypothetical protein [Rhodospirillales bacterium]